MRAAPARSIAPRDGCSGSAESPRRPRRRRGCWPSLSGSVRRVSAPSQGCRVTAQIGCPGAGKTVAGAGGRQPSWACVRAVSRNRAYKGMAGSRSLYLRQRTRKAQPRRSGGHGACPGAPERAGSIVRLEVDDTHCTPPPWRGDGATPVALDSMAVQAVSGEPVSASIPC
jgi:hypothetical protein